MLNLSHLCHTMINLLLDPSVYPFITPYPIQAIPNANFISDHNAGMFCYYLWIQHLVRTLLMFAPMVRLTSGHSTSPDPFVYPGRSFLPSVQYLYDSSAG